MKRIAVLSSNLPDEWFTHHPIQIVRHCGDSHAPPVPLREGMCAYLAYLPGLLSEVDGMVLPTSCDQMRRGAEWLADAQRVFLFNVPSTLHQDRLLDSERTRLDRWLRELAPRSPASNPDRMPIPDPSYIHPPSAERDPAPPPIAIGLLGGHLCIPRQTVMEFFAKKGMDIRLWGCEGGEYVGDIFQRPNTAFHVNVRHLVRVRSLQGLIVVRTTGCDLWRLTFPRLMEVCDLPMLEWVVEGYPAGQPFPDARTATRFEAFRELLSARRNFHP